MEIGLDVDIPLGAMKTSENANWLPVRCVIPVEKMEGGDPQDTGLLRSMAEEAENFLSSFTWCESVQRRYFGFGIGKVVAVFFFEIKPAGADRWIWVVTGDLPPAYLVIDECKSPAEALTAYISEMMRWVELAKRGKTSSDVIPVNVPATPEWARALGSRLEFLQVNVLPLFREAEIQRS